MARAPPETGLLAAVQTLPFLLLAMPLGLLADRMPRRRLMLRAEVLRALSLLLMLAVLAAPWSARMGIAGMALLGFIGAIGTVAFSVAAPALVPELVPREALARANGRIELARSAAFAAGPAVAGALVAWTGAAAAFVLAAALSAAAVALLWKLPEPARRMPAARHPWTELREGARFVLSHAWLRLMLLTGAIFNIAWFVLQAGYVPHAVRALGLGAQGVGLTLAMYGAGMVVGALLTPAHRGAHEPGPCDPRRSLQRGAGRGVDGVDTAVAQRRARGLVAVRVRRRADGVDHQFDHLAPGRDTRGHAGPRLGRVPHGECRRAARGRGARRGGRRALGRSRLPAARARGLRAAGGRDRAREARCRPLGGGVAQPYLSVDQTIARQPGWLAGGSRSQLRSACRWLSLRRS